MKNSIYILLFLFLLFSCSKEQEKSTTEPSFKVLEFKKASFPSSLVYKGSVVQGLHWSDKNGDNYFLLTEENMAENMTVQMTGITRQSTGTAITLQIIREQIINC